MKLFGKKKETKSCCCGENCTSETMQNTENKKQEQGRGQMSNLNLKGL